MPKLTSKRLGTLRKEFWGHQRSCADKLRKDNVILPDDLWVLLNDIYDAISDAEEILHDLEQEDGHTT